MVIGLTYKIVAVIAPIPDEKTFAASVPSKLHRLLNKIIGEEFLE